MLAAFALALASLAAASIPEASPDPTDRPLGQHATHPAVPDAQAAFAFALIGDIPYNPLEAGMLAPLFESFDADLSFAIHIGDLKASWERCDDSLLGARLALLATSPVPLVFVPGDNEWTDCGRTRAGAFDPRERLDWLRKHVFSKAAPLAASLVAQPGEPARSGPATDPSPFVGLERQADRRADGLPENLRWRHGGVRFVSLNVPGSNNGLAADGLDANDWRTRLQLNAAWLRDSYELARRDREVAMVVIAHANVGFDRDSNDAGRASGAGRSGAMTVDRLMGRTDGYAALRALLFEASNAFEGPTLFLHGDSHHHRIERLSPKLMRVESYGSPFSNLWVRIDVNPAAYDPFRISSRRVDRDPPLP